MELIPTPDPSYWPEWKPRRQIVGMSAVFLPFEPDGSVSWDSFRRHLHRTIEAGLTPAVNMDTGFVQFLDTATQQRVLHETRSVLAGRKFVAGAFVADQPGDSFQLDAYLRAIDRIQDTGGLPIVFPSFGLTSLGGGDVLAAYDALAQHCPKFLAFELSPMFAPFGRIYDLATFSGLLMISACIGLKHSSLSRIDEWQRLRLRDEIRPDFLILTGNDWAIDMVMFGSDYLLGLSTFAPEAFALRDRYWAEGDPRFFEVNDLLQYLGRLAFRTPISGYKHTAAQFLAMRGWIASDFVPSGVPKRPESDLPLLADILDQLQRLTSTA